MSSAEASRRRPSWPLLVIASLVLGRWAWQRLPALVPERESEQVDTEPEHDWVVPYRDEARALLGNLEPGDELAATWRVERVEGPLPDGRIKVLATRDELRFAAWIVPRGYSSHEPPVHSERWDLFYDRAQPPGTKLDSSEYIRVLEVLAERVRAHESGGPAPSPSG